MSRISSCFFSFLLLFLPATAEAKADKAESEAEEAPTPIYQGTYVSVDLLNPISHLIGTRFMQYEIAADVNLKNRFFPIIELGYGHVNNSSDNGLTYKSHAPYCRVGLNYNTMAKKKRESHFYAGVRYGFSRYQYDIHSSGLQDPVWNAPISFDRAGMKTFSHWLELVIGIRVQIKSNFMMGWSVRLKRALSLGDHGDNAPWYIPGYGYNAATAYGGTYSIIYKFDINRNKK